MDAKLFCPHSKDYCVSYQSRLATLKGIENVWNEITPDQSCEWENQQHGRNHHLKVVVSKPVDGAVLGLRLCQEDGTPAPDFAKTKNGTKKPTMLVGLDSREGCLGLTWTSLTCEGPRRWVPASSCIIVVSSKNPKNTCDASQGEDRIVLNIHPSRDIFIPIRVEVLSAAKGAGDFSRYSINCFQMQSIARRSPLKNGWGWSSPAVLIEAKWLPAAPVRMTNRQKQGSGRRQSSSASTDGQNDNDSCGENHSHSTHQEKNESVFGPSFTNQFNRTGIQQQPDLSSNSRPGKFSSNGVTTPSGGSTLEHLLATFNLLTSFLRDPSSFTQDLSLLSSLDVPVQELQCALSQYIIMRTQPQRLQSSQGNSGFFFQNVSENQSGDHHLQSQRTTSQPQFSFMSSIPLNNQQHQQQLFATQHPLKHENHSIISASAPDKKPTITATKKKASNKRATENLMVKPVDLSNYHVSHQDEGSNSAPPKKRQKTPKPELLSSPPRGPKFAPISSEMMAAITLPGSAYHASTQPYQHQSTVPEASFAEFDLLATAASASQCVIPTKR